MSIEGIRKCLVLSIRFCWRLVCQHPFVAGLLLFMLFLYRYFPSIFFFLIYYSPVISCTSLLLGALLVYGEPYIAEPEVLISADVSAKGERNILDKDLKNRRTMDATINGVFNLMHDDGDGKSNTVLAASSPRNSAEIEICNEKTLADELEARDLKFIAKQVFPVENPAESSIQTAEGLKVEIKKPLINQFESSLGSPWQQVNGGDVSSCSESDGDESSSSDTSVTDIVPIIDELNPLLESKNLLQDHRSNDSSDSVSRASSPEHEFDDGSAEEETEIQADEEDEEAQEDKDNGESIVKWTADDEKNLMDLGSSELERNRRLENLIAKRRAKKLQRFQTDKNLIDLDAEPLPFMEELSRLNVQIPAISAPRCNPFDLPYDSQDNMGLPPIPGSAPSVLLPSRNPFDLPYDQDEESSKITCESSRTYGEPRINPYFVAEKKIGEGFASFERQLSEKSDSKESSASESDSVSAVAHHDHELSESQTHERMSFMNQDLETSDQQSDLSVQVGSDQEHSVANTVEQEIGDVESTSPLSSSTNLEVIDERYDGSTSSSCPEEDDKCNETRIHIESTKSGLPIEGTEVADDSQIADPVYDSSPSALSSVSHIPSLDEDLVSKFKGKEGFITGSSLSFDKEANLLDDVDVNLRGKKNVKDFHTEDLIPELEVQELDSLEDSCAGKQDSAMELPQSLGLDSGSSPSSFDGKFEVKNDESMKLNQETAASSNTLDPKNQIDLLL